MRPGAFNHPPISARAFPPVSRADRPASPLNAPEVSGAGHLHRIARHDDADCAPPASELAAARMSSRDAGPDEVPDWARTVARHDDAKPGCFTSSLFDGGCILIAILAILLVGHGVWKGLAAGAAGLVGL